MNISEVDAMPLIADELARLFNAECRIARAKRPHHACDLTAEVGEFRFLIEFKDLADLKSINRGATQLEECCDAGGFERCPLLVVPFMTEHGRSRCKERSMSWMDLSGNADISASGIRVLVLGQPNRYVTRGRPSSPFARKSSSIAKLLLRSSRGLSQAEIARETGLGDGYVSRIVSRLQQEGYVDIDDGRKVRARDRGLLLDGIRERYEFAPQVVRRGNIELRGNKAQVVEISRRLQGVAPQYAVTGMAAACMRDAKCGFSTFALYLPHLPTMRVLEALEFSESATLSNAFIALPRDEGLFHALEVRQGVHCVDLLQNYLDLDDRVPSEAGAARMIRERIVKC